MTSGTIPPADPAVPPVPSIVAPAGRAALFDEPACDHNRSKSATGRKAGCPMPVPGNSAGGCSFDGGMITLLPISDAAQVVHGPITCAGTGWEGRGTDASGGPALFRHGFTSDVDNSDLLLGGEQKLYDTIEDVIRRHRPAAVFVHLTCVTAMIGDDVESVCDAVSRAHDLPVIPVHAPGLTGSKNLGNRLAGKALLDHVIGTCEPEAPGPYDVNLIGEYNIAGELWNVLPVLAETGIRVTATITGDSRYADIAAAHRAKATMVVCSRALLPLARGLQERYGVPWFEGSFYGLRSMADSLRNFARILGGEVAERVEDVIARHEAQAEAELAPLRTRLAGKKAVLYTGGVKSWSMVAALQDLGMQVVASGATKSTAEDVDRIEELLDDDGEIVHNGSPAELLRIVTEAGADILIAGGRNQYTAVKGRLPFLDVNQERHTPLAGYPGVVEMARRIVSALENPVWQQVRDPAPWESASAPGTGEVG
jgi:nitrogenase molybdenum-cofactor synthesis protein NifE